MNKKKILFMMSGSIACYKACQVISNLAKKDVHIETALSKNALHFIGPSTIEGLTGRAPLMDEYTTSRNMDHIYLNRESDAIVFCPATAKSLNEFAYGCGGFLTTLFLAHDFKKPFYVFPAMNQSMYLHPTTQNSIGKLKEMGLQIFPPEEGDLACKEEGPGRLMEPQKITDIILKGMDL